MKLRVFFLKKKHLLYFLIVATFFIIVLSLFNLKRRSAPTFMSIKDSKSIKADFNGDGEEDLLYINIDKNKYYLQVNTKNDSYFLEPEKKLNTMGELYHHWPLRINFTDISRDKIPEIFIQSSQNNLPIQHVFLWDNKQFKDIYCSNNNVMGFLDSENNKTPKYISGNIKNGNIAMSYNILIGKEFKNYSYDSSKFPGKDIILNFIHYIESLPEGEVNKPDIFYSGLTAQDIAVIGQLAAEGNNYKFLDGSFKDSKWNKEGEIIELKWTMNFGYNLKTPESSKSKHSLKLILKPCEAFNNEFRISSLSISNE
ncbi:FG-GAP repeat domain-containing protein [Clostridium simiarum]|nr:VCBS repeat-containing protein [Clostridium simiarum]